MRLIESTKRFGFPEHDKERKLILYGYQLGKDGYRFVSWFAKIETISTVPPTLILFVQL